MKRYKSYKYDEKERWELIKICLDESIHSATVDKTSVGCYCRNVACNNMISLTIRFASSEY